MVRREDETGAEVYFRIVTVASSSRWPIAALPPPGDLSPPFSKIVQTTRNQDPIAIGSSLLIWTIFLHDNQLMFASKYRLVRNCFKAEIIVKFFKMFVWLQRQ